MTAMTRRFSATVLIGLALGSPSGTRSSLQLLQPGTMRTVRAIRLPSAFLGYAWARRFDTLAVVVKPVATGQPIRILDARTMRVRRTIEVGDRDVCGLTFRGRTLLALAADRPCYWSGGHFSVLRIVGGRIVRVAPVAGLSTAAPTNLAFGDGNAYVTQPGGTIETISLRTGALTVHRPRRTLAKGERIEWTTWIGRHRLAVGGNVVDVRTWRKRPLAPGVTRIAGSGGVLVGFGARGATVVRGSVRRHVLGDEPVNEAWVAGGLLYAAVGVATDVVDLRTGVRVRVVPRYLELLP
jgi:hypothetical protein